MYLLSPIFLGWLPRNQLNRYTESKLGPRLKNEKKKKQLCIGWGTFVLLSTCIFGACYPPQAGSFFFQDVKKELQGKKILELNYWFN
jgi:hypothetical protein